MNCKNTRSCCSPYSELAQRLEETNTRAVQAYNNAQYALTLISQFRLFNTDGNLDIDNGLRVINLAEDVTIADQLTVDGDAVFNGDIIQNGASYETHAQKVYTTDDYIITRDGAVGALAVGDYSGFQVKKYDGTNDGRLVMDRDGIARVGDVGDEQPLATRDEAADMTDGQLVQWDGTNTKLITSGKTIADITGMELVAEHDLYYDMTGYEGTEVRKQVVPGSGFKFEAGYDYFIFFNTVPAANVNVYASPTGTAGVNDAFFYIDIQANSSSFYTTYTIYRMKTGNPLAGNLVRFNTTGSASTTDQPKLISGTNIKTVGGVSLLGSGDVPAGGLTWTLRADNSNWSDMFEIVDSKLHAKKHIYLYMNAYNIYLSVYIPKDLAVPSPARFPVTSRMAGGSSSFEIKHSIMINSNAITSSNIDVYYDIVSFTTDGSSVTVNRNVNNAMAFDKSNYVIYTAD